MLIEQRHSRLQELLAQRGMSDLESLSADLRVSQSTVRRDLESLESRGLVRRTHGGVISVGDRTNGTRPHAFRQGMGMGVGAERGVGKGAAGLVQPGQTVLLDGGTTTFYLAEQLLGQSLQIVT